MHIIVGLGNPGTRYARTRHNIGFMVIDQLARQAGIRVTRKESHALVGRGTLGGRELLLVKPQTFMNESGMAVGPLLRHHGGGLGNLLVVVDDMDLPPGRLRFRPGGSSGGQKGLKSIGSVLGTQDFPRLRLGIGRPETDAVDHVLSGFGEQWPLVQKTIAVAVEAVACFVSDGIETAMNRFNATMLDAE